MMQIGEGGHARVYANVLHARFRFLPTLIYIEEEVLSKSDKIDRTILQLSFRDDEGQLWLLPPSRYRAFGLNAALMVASTDLISQLSDMSSIQPLLLHSVKLEKPDNLVNLSNDSSEGALPNAPPPTPVIHIPVGNSKYSEHSKSVFTPVGSSGHSNLSRPPCHLNTREYPNVMQCLRRLASFPGSRNKLATLNYDKIPYHKVQYLPPSYDGDVIFELPPSCAFASTSKNTMDSMDKRFDGHIWCRTITSNIHNSQSLTFRKSLYVGQLVCNNKSCVSSSLDPPSAMRLSGQAGPTLHSN
jgi:hypothetical protein